MAVNSTAIDIETGPPSETELLQRDGKTWSEIAVPLVEKGSTYFLPRRPEMMFGRPIDVPGPLFELKLGELVEMHRYVRHNVVPRFYSFFPPETSHGVAS